MMEEDLMDAMNAALEENFGSEHSGHSSLRSVDVMDEAMNLLMGEEEVKPEDDAIGNDDDEEEIDFEDFLSPVKDSSTTNASAASASAVATEPAKGGNGLKSSNGEEEREKSPTSVAEAVDGGGDKKAKEDKSDDENNNKTTDFLLEIPKEPQVVPLRQFENALALIQDLENRVQVLETDRQCLAEENEQLREVTNQQATSIADMEFKLERFPKLMQQTVQEESCLAAKQAEVETRKSFWRRDMARQEQEFLEKKLKKNRANASTTESLKQADFLKDVVERKEQEEKQQQQQEPEGSSNRNSGMGPGLILKALRGWGSRNNSVSSSQNGTPTAASTGGKEDSQGSPKTEGVGGDDSTSMELRASKSNDSIGGGGRPSMNFDDEEDAGIDDDKKDSSVLDLVA